MKLSQTSRQMTANTTWGFNPVDVDPDDPVALAGVFRCDWSPIIFKGNTRIGSNFISCQALFADVDNTSEPLCTMVDFASIFKGVNYILSTSKSHQKYKKDSPPADRFHVLFPLEEPIFDPEEMTGYLKAMIELYPFFDKAVSGPAQLVFANPSTIVTVNPGKQIDLELLKSVKPKKESAQHRPEHHDPPVSDWSEADYLSTPANRVRLMTALKNSATAGVFEEYHEWIKVGIALKASGFSAEDFASISNDDAIDEAIKRWDTFDPKQVTPGTLVYYAKMSTDLHLYSQDEMDRFAQGDAIFSEWRRNEQEEVTKLLASRTKDVKAGPAPAGLMPQSGLIREIASYILSSSIRPLPALAVASATAFVSALIGRRYESPTGLGSNIYFVGLAESGSGKEWARKCIKNIAYESGCQQLMGGETIASGAGLRSSLEEYPTRLFLLDEFGITLQGLTSKNAGSYQRDIIATLMKLYSSYGSVYYGTEYSDKKMRARVDIQSPCCVVYGTSTHQEFYNALSGGDGASGNIARMLIVNEPHGRANRQEGTGQKIPRSIIERVKELATYKSHEGNLSPYMPVVVPYKSDEIKNAFGALDDSMSEKMTDSESNSVYSRVAENAIKLALVHAVSRDHISPVIDERAFAWGRDLSLWCANTLMEQFNTFVADSDHGRTIKRVLLKIKEAGKDGISGNELLRKVQEIRKQERNEILETLQKSGQIFQDHVQSGKGTQDRYFHADFWKGAKE